MEKMVNPQKRSGSFLVLLVLLLNLSTLSQAEWEKVFEAPEDTELYTIGFASPGNGWVAGSRGTLYRTSSDGRQWRRYVVEDLPKDYDIETLLFLENQTGWAVADSPLGLPDEGVLLHTTDGNQWQIQHQRPSRLASLSFLDSKEGFVRVLGGPFLHTMDSGKTWESADTFPTPPYGRIHFFDRFRWVFLGPDRQLYRTVDAGQTWQSFPTPGHSLGYFHFWDSQIGWFAQVSREFGFPPFRQYHLYRTTNGGMNWEFLLEVDSLLTDTYFLDSQEGWVVESHRRRRDVVNSFILHTRDGVLTWDRELLTEDLEYPRKMVSDQRRLWIVTSRSVYRQIGGLEVSPKEKLVMTWGKIKTAD